MNGKGLRIKRGGKETKTLRGTPGGFAVAVVVRTLGRGA